MKKFTSYVMSLIVACLTLIPNTAEAETLKERLSKRTRPAMQVLGQQTLTPMQFQMNNAGIKTAKKGIPMMAPEQTAKMQANSFGFIQGPDGMWSYTQTFKSANYYYTQSVITLYNSHHQQMGQITVDINDGRKVNHIEPSGIITSKMFDSDEDTYELAVYIHEVGTEMNSTGTGYEQINKMIAYRMDGTQVYQVDGVGMFVDMEQNEWSRYQRMLAVNDDYTDTIEVNVIAPARFGAEPKIEHTFRIPWELTNYSDGGYISVAQIDNQPYFIVAHYEKPWCEDYDLTTWDPIPTKDNNYILKVYNKNYKLVDSLSVPVVKSDAALFGFASFGLMSEKDASKGFFANDGNINYVISYYEYLSGPDEYRYNFVVVDNKGNKIKTVCENVSNAWFNLSNVDGFEEQMVFMQTIGEAQQLSVVNIPSCEVETVIPAELHGEKISTNLDRYPKGDSYQYVMSMGSAIGDENDNVIARIGWYNRDLSLDHFTSYNLGQYGQLFTPLIDSDGLNPYLFDTDDDHEFAFIAKIGSANSSKLDDILFIGEEDGTIKEKFVGNTTLGDLYSAIPMNRTDGSSELVVVYYKSEEDLYDINYYDLPFTMFQGGSGKANDPYLIATVGDLQQMKRDMSANYKLVADLDMSNMPTAWTPLNGFSGKFDGDNHSISNLLIDNELSQSGFFGSMAEGGSIRNLVLVNPELRINKGNSYAGFIAGMTMTDTLQNIHIYNANIINKSKDVDATVGGLVGQATVYSEISSCSFNNGTISLPASTATGGIAGDTRTSSYVFSSTASGKFEAESGLGGIVGITGTDGQVFDCHANVNLVAQHTVGGIVGNNGSRAAINKNYAKGTIKASKASWNGFAAGGILGRIESDWSQAETIVLNGNVAEMNITVNSAGAAPTSTHRIIGYTIADETYSQGEKRYTEIGLANNYATATATINGRTISSDAATSTEGASKAAADYNKEFFAGLGYAYGTTAAAPWKGEKGMPVLYFENNPMALQFDAASAMITEGESGNLVITVYGTDASEISVTSSDAAVAEVEIIGEEENCITVKVTGKKIGNAVLTATAGNITATCNIAVVDKSTGIENVVTGNAVVEGIYNINGMRLNSLQKGLNIIKMSNGTTKKVMVK